MILTHNHTGVAKDVVDAIRAEFPEFTVTFKRNSELMKAADICLLIITLGQMREFMTKYTTTVGYTIYVPDSWATRSEKSQAITLRHECVHMRQRKKYGWFLFVFLYLFCAPTIFAYWRAKFEKEAYEESIRATADYYGVAYLLALKSYIVSHFLDVSYFWMWPFRTGVERWFDEAVNKVIAERAQP